MEPNPHILRHHHITLSVGTAQEDYDFHTQVLGLKSVKKTALYDGDEPRFGERMLCFSHPCGIGYAMVAIDDDNRRPYSNGHIPAEFGIRGTHGITVSLRDADSSDEFMQYG
jgi:catechol 2,3-dioxygenase-like lactoylglutathione lyase family enzyme